MTLNSDDILSTSANRRLGRNVASLSALQALNYIVPLVTVPYLVRALDASHYGLISFAQAFILIFDLITDYGFNLSATRTVAANQSDHEAVSKIFWTTMIAKTVLMIASGIVIATLVLTVRPLRNFAPLYAVSFLTVLGTVAFPAWLLQGMEEMRLIAWSQCAGRLLTIPAIFLWVHHSADYVLAAAIQSSPQLVASLLAAPFLRRRFGIGLYLPKRSDLLQAFQGGWHLFLSSLSGFLYSSSTVLILGIVAGSTEVGYFTAADKIVKAITSFLNPLTQSLYPHLSALKSISSEAPLRLLRSASIWIGAASLGLSMAAWLFAEPVGAFVFGRNFAESIRVLRILSPLPFLYGLSAAFGTLTMLVFEMDASMSRILLGCAVLNIVLTAVLAKAFGAAGAALAVVVTAFVMACSMALAVQRRRLAVWQTAARSKPLPEVVT